MLEYKKHYFDSIKVAYSFSPVTSLYGKSSGSYSSFPAGIYLFKVNNGNTKTKCEIFAELTIKTPPEWRQWSRSGDFIVNFEHITTPVFPLNLNK